MYTREYILEYLKSKKASYYRRYNINKLGLFGSFARNQQTEKSDIDILIDFLVVNDNIYDIKNDIKKEIKLELNINADICREKAINKHFRKFILSETIYV